MRRIGICLGLTGWFWLLGLLVAQAQPEQAQWVFGFHAGLQFDSLGRPAPTAAPALVSAEASSTVADSAGRLLVYTNGAQVWDRTHAPMPNGALGSGPAVQSATQGGLVVRQPGMNSPYYYVFTVAAREDGLAAGLHYSRLDMRLRGGLGDVETARKNLRLLPGRQLAEKLTAIRHRNRRDYWLVVHGWQTNEFYSLLLTPNGPAAAPVISAVGQQHRGPALALADSLANAAGYLRASPDGRWLAVAAGQLAPELLTFDTATGQVARPQVLTGLPAGRYYGATFSPDNSKLYLSCLTSDLYQVDLANNLTIAVLKGAAGNICALALGPDGRLYLAEDGREALSVLNRPNQAGPACDLQAAAVPLGGLAHARYATLGLPNFPTEVDPRFLRLTGPTQACAGDSLIFNAELMLDSLAAAAFEWELADPANPAVATGGAVVHCYSQPGTYTVRVVAIAVDGRRFGAVLRVQVMARPVLDLGPPVQGLCSGQPLVLAPLALEPGAAYQWSDGPTGPRRSVTVPGRYFLRLRSPGGCLALDSVTVVPAPSFPIISLGPDSVLCASAFPLTVWVPALPAGTRWRWPDSSTGRAWAVPGPGLVALEMETDLGCRASATRRFTVADCPSQLPTIITPNGDAFNQAFVLGGLRAADWSLTIFNRWGREVYHRQQYDNSWTALGQPAGLYYYWLANSQTGQHYKGWVEVAR